MQVRVYIPAGAPCFASLNRDTCRRVCDHTLHVQCGMKIAWFAKPYPRGGGGGERESISFGVIGLPTRCCLLDLGYPGAPPGCTWQL